MRPRIPGSSLAIGAEMEVEACGKICYAVLGTDILGEGEGGGYTCPVMP